MEGFNLSYLFMSEIAFVNIIGSLNVYFRFNSCLISACAMRINNYTVILLSPSTSSSSKRGWADGPLEDSIYMFYLPLG